MLQKSFTPLSKESLMVINGDLKDDKYRYTILGFVSRNQK